MPGGHDYFYTLQEICVLLNLQPGTFRQMAREYADLVSVREQVRKGRTVLGLPRAEFEALRAILEMRSRGTSGEEIRAVLGRGGSPPVGAPPVETATLRVPIPPGDASPAAPTTEGPHPAAGQPASVGSGASGPAGSDETGGQEGPPAAVRMSSPEPGPFDDEGPPGRQPTWRSDVPVRSERTLALEIAALREELKEMDERRREERDRLLTALMRTQHELQSLRYEVGTGFSRRDRKKRRGFWAWLFDL